jgi:ABC-2 type transport system permease protein
MFMLLVFLEVLSGVIFPLNILPQWAYQIVKFTPFPYLVYFPLGVLIGKFSPSEINQILIGSLIWLTIGLLLVKKMWKSGLVIYSASGR